MTPPLPTAMSVPSAIRTSGPISLRTGTSKIAFASSNNAPPTTSSMTPAAITPKLGPVAAGWASVSIEYIPLQVTQQRVQPTGHLADDCGDDAAVLMLRHRRRDGFGLRQHQRDDARRRRHA